MQWYWHGWEVTPQSIHSFPGKGPKRSRKIKNVDDDGDNDGHDREVDHTKFDIDDNNGDDNDG